MTEINATGVYEYNLDLLATWPLGEYTIICSESTTGSADSMTLKVMAPEVITVDLSAVTTRLDALDAQLSGIAADQSTMNSTLTTMSGDISTIQSDLAAMNTLLQAMTDDINTLLESWNALNLTQLKDNVDLLVKYMGTPNDSQDMQTLFGKIAKTYGVVNQMPVAAVYAEIQALRKEVDFQGKSETTYTMLENISAAIDDLQVAGSGTNKTAETSMELAAASKSVAETREALGAIAKEAGVGTIISSSPAAGKELSLQTLYDQMAELKALAQTIIEMLRKRDTPVVNSWLESGSVKQIILVANSSKTVTEDVPVKRYLPEGVKPEDIISMGDFKLGYDFDRSLYYVHQKVKLAPGASMKLEVVMNDVWRIDEMEIAMFREHVKRLAAILAQSRYAAQVKVLCENIERRLERILKVQNTVTETKDRLANYEINKKVLEDVKVDIGSLEDLVVEVQGLPTDKILGAIAPAPTPAGAGEVQPPKKKINLKIEMENKLAISNTNSLEYYLPAEIMPDLIANLGGLEVKYDPEKKVHCLLASNLVFAPAGTPGCLKSFTIELNDIWYIPNQQLGYLRSHTEKLVGMFTDSEARPSAEFLGKRIMQELAAISNSQQLANLTADVHIGNYRENVQRLQEVKKDIARLERLIVQTGGTPGLTMAERDIKIKEGGAIPAAGSKAKALGTVNTWRIIWTIIAFAGIISLVFFMIWWMQLMKKESIKLERLETIGKDQR
jgi:hypothetical protein